MILALRALGVGDLVTAVPALRALRAGHPDRPLVLAAPGWLTPLAALVGGIDAVLPVEGLDGGLPVAGLARALPVERPDGGPPLDRPATLLRPGAAPELAVNLHGRGPESLRLLRRAGARRLLAFGCPSAGHRDGPLWDDDEHEVTRWCRLVRWAGLPADPTDLALRRPEPGRLPVGVTVLHPGAKFPAKRWAPERFAALARELTGQGHRVVFTGSAAERGLATSIAAAAGLPADAVLAGRTGLTDLAALIGYARLLVSGDTGAAHLATAYRTPSVVLFGPVSPRHWGPPPERPWHRVLWAATETDPRLAHGAASGGRGAPAVAARLRPSGGGVWPPGAGVAEQASPGAHPALARLTVDEVVAAVREAERAAKVAGAAAA